MLVIPAVVTLLAGFIAIGLYAPKAWDLHRGGLDTSDEIQSFAVWCGVSVSGACAVVTAINVMVR